MSYKVSNVVDFRVTPLNIKIRNGMKVINKDISLVEEEIIALDEKILIDLLSYEKIKIDSLRAHKNNLTDRLKLLNNERYDFINFEIPKFKIELERVKDEVLLRNNIIDDYKLLLNPSSYKNTKLITKIIAPQKPHSPDLFLYLIFGFLSSFSLLLFIFLFACMIIFLLLSIPIAFLHVGKSDTYLITHPFPQPTSKNEKGLSNEIFFKNFKTFIPCPFSIDSAFPFIAQSSNFLLTLSMINSIFLFNYNLLDTDH